MDYDSRNTRSSGYDSDDDDRITYVTAQPSLSRSSRSTQSSRHGSEQSSPDCYLVPENASSADRRRVRADLRTIRNHSRDENAPQHIRNMMTEVIEVAPRTEIHPGLEGVGGAAYTTRRYTNGTSANHESHYHGQVDDEGQRIGNLVHELTHASIGESFDRDYVHYTNQPRVVVAEPEFNETGDRMTNEADRQAQRRVPDADNKISVKLENLQKLTHKSKVLNTEQKQWIIERLNYGIQQPHIEFDTVINQIATQLHYWEITPAMSKVAERIEHYVNRLQGERRSGNREVRSTRRTPTYRPGMAPVRERRQSGCNVM